MPRSLPPAWLGWSVAACVLSTGCSFEFEGPPPPTDRFESPSAIAATPDMRHVLVANGNFGKGHRGGAVLPLDVNCREIHAEGAVELGSFASQLRVHPNGRRAYVTVRGDDSVTWLDLQTTDAGELQLRCGQGSEKVCVDSRLWTIRDLSSNDSFLREPFDIELACARDGLGCRYDPEQPSAFPVDGLIVSYLRDGEIAGFQLDDEGTPISTSGERMTSMQHPTEPKVVDGLNGVLVSDDGRFGFASSFRSSLVQRFRIDLSGDTSPALAADVSAALLGATYNQRSSDVRDMVLVPRTHRFLAAVRNPTRGQVTPDSILVVDATPNVEGAPTTELAGVIPLSARPGKMKVLPGEAGRPDLVYVALYADNSLAVVDASNIDMIATIRLDAGPYDLTFVVEPSGEAPPEERRMEAWVVEFSSNSVAIIDINPDSPDYHQVIHRISESQPSACR